MTDVLSWRCKFGVLGPLTYTIVQPDFDDMRPRGVTNNCSRIFTPNANAVSNESFRASAEVKRTQPRGRSAVVTRDKTGSSV
jgi:maleate isomerase